MDDLWLRIVEDLNGRVSGPMRMRLLLQPLVAIVLAVLAGMKDAREGRPPYFFGLVTSSGHRRERISEGWKNIGKVFIAALILDVVYQLIVLRFVYPGEAVLVAIVLAILPYILIRGVVTRVMRSRGRTRAGGRP